MSSHLLHISVHPLHTQRKMPKRDINNRHHFAGLRSASRACRSGSVSISTIQIHFSGKFQYTVVSNILKVLWHLWRWSEWYNTVNWHCCESRIWALIVIKSHDADPGWIRIYLIFRSVNPDSGPIGYRAGWKPDQGPSMDTTLRPI